MTGGEWADIEDGDPARWQFFGECFNIYESDYRDWENS